MRSFILLSFAIIILYGCIEISGKEPENKNIGGQVNLTQNPPDGRLRVGKNEVQNMRGRRAKDNAVVKISAKDLLALISSSSPATEDSLIFYFVKYDSQEDKDRYLLKNPGAKWNDVKGKSSLLVGYMNNGMNKTMNMTRRIGRPTVALFDLGVVCPPPPDCDCEIEQ